LSLCTRQATSPFCAGSGSHFSVLNPRANEIHVPEPGNYDKIVSVGTAITKQPLFGPTRWISTPERLVEQEHRLVSVSRDGRGCIGKNLRMCKTQVTLATLFREFDNLQECDCGPDDMVYVEAFTAFHP